MLFIKNVSDKYSNDPNGIISVPKGGGFKAISQLKGQKNIGEKIDTIIGALAKANELEGVIDVVSFNDEDKLGKGKEMVDRLSDLVSIFDQDSLNFSKNKAGGDDILGDAYVYLMRHFATESGKSKGLFYTPAEVSRMMAKLLQVSSATNHTTIYDPTYGSGSRLLKVLDEANGKGTLYGQEKDVTTAGLAKMNMILHNAPTAEIRRGQSTLSNPLFLDRSNHLQGIDYIVANPPFSLANWTQGFIPSDDEYNRFSGYGIPPEKNGDYAFLLHIVGSLKSKGKGAVILPHGVLFRGNAEAEIRKNLIQKGLIQCIIGLLANFFYVTVIPACIIILDKSETDSRTGIFMVDASKGFIKDGNKNLLREQDIHKMVDVYTNQLEVPKYSRFVSLKEIADPKNDYNLNIPRYIDLQDTEDIQDIASHLLGGIPARDIDALAPYWKAYPNLKDHLFKASKREGYYDCYFAKEEIKQAILGHADFKSFSTKMNKLFQAWSADASQQLKSLSSGLKPKEVIHGIAESLLATYEAKPLIDMYDVYQHLLNYWAEVMQDDLYLIEEDGWVATPYPIIDVNKKTGKETTKGWTCDLIPPSLLIEHFFKKEQDSLEVLESEKEGVAYQLAELEEKHSEEEGYFVYILNHFLIQIVTIQY